jgi:predicted RNA-binding protein
MCQVNVVLDKNGEQEKVMENVTLLTIEPEGVLISTLFEKPKLIAGAKLTKIDFLNGTVTLTD